MSLSAGILSGYRLRTEERLLSYLSVQLQVVEQVRNAETSFRRLGMVACDSERELYRLKKRIIVLSRSPIRASATCNVVWFACSSNCKVHRCMHSTMVLESIRGISRKIFSACRWMSTSSPHWKTSVMEAFEGKVLILSKPWFWDVQSIISGIFLNMVCVVSIWFRFSFSCAELRCCAPPS